MTRAKLSPSALERLRRMEILVGAFVESVSAGKHASRGFGTSAHFADHREYHPGEDPRAVDWRASARGDRLVVKRFEHEGRLEATLLLDVSASMRFAGEDDTTTKIEHGAVLIEGLARVILASGDATSVERVAFEASAQTTMRGGTGHLEAVLALLATDEQQTVRTQLTGALESVLVRARKPRLVVLASDLLEVGDAWIAAASALAARGHRVAVLHTLTREEMELSLSGMWRLIDAEDGAEAELDIDAVREEYVREFGAWRKSVEDKLHASRIVYRTAVVGDDVVKTIEELLNQTRAFWN